jgi:hypothetical protein
MVLLPSGKTPISNAELSQITPGSGKLKQYSRERIFHTLFTPDGVSDEHRGNLWIELMRDDDISY